MKFGSKYLGQSLALGMMVVVLAGTVVAITQMGSQDIRGRAASSGQYPSPTPFMWMPNGQNCTSCGCNCCASGDSLNGVCLSPCDFDAKKPPSMPTVQCDATPTPTPTPVYCQHMCVQPSACANFVPGYCTNNAVCCTIISLTPTPTPACVVGKTKGCVTPNGAAGNIVCVSPGVWNTSSCQSIQCSLTCKTTADCCNGYNCKNGGCQKN